MSAPESVHLKVFYEILEFLGGLREGEEDKAWVRVVDKLSVALDCEAATYFVMGPKGRQLVPHYSLGVPPDQLVRIPIEIGKGICGWVAKHSEPLLIDDAYKDPRFMPEVDQATGFKTKTILCFPLMDRLDLVGVLELINRRGGPFTQEHLRFVQAVCRQAAFAARAVKLEAMLNKVTAHNASILENLSGGFLAVDLRGRIMICNPAARRILEVDQDILNAPVHDALKHLPQLADILTQTVTTRQIVKRKDLTWSHKGQSRLLGYSTLLIQDPQGNLTGAGVTFQDISSLKR